VGAPLVIALAVVACLVAIALALGVARTAWSRLPTRALLAGNPRRSRALARILARGRPPQQRAKLAMFEANALLWEGQLRRAIALLDQRVIPLSEPSLGIVPIVLKLECLIFDERHEEAEALFAAHADALHSTRDARADVAVIAGFLRCHAGDLDGARAVLEASPAPLRDPIRRAAHFCLAAIAHRQQRTEAVRRHLAQAIYEGGDLFVARWAMAQWEALLPVKGMPSREVRSHTALRMPRMLRALPGSLWVGINVLFFRTAALRARTFSGDQVVGLVLLNLVLAVGLRCVDYTPKAYFLETNVLTVAAPILFFLLTAHVAQRRGGGRDVTLRLLAGFYGALPVMVALAFIAARRHEDYDRSVGTFDLILGAWLVAMVMRLIHAVVPRAGVLRILGCAVLFGVTWILPMHLVGSHSVFFTPRVDVEAIEAEERRRDELVFAEADKVHAAEALLAPERSGVTDLYFVGAAGWASQDVFARELRSARHVLDSRFDTEGRSIILANDSTSDVLPLASSPTLRHVIDAVGKRLDHEEDVLFLFVTSHGSTEGLAIRPPRSSAFHAETLTPGSLRSMLDHAGIKWRVLVVSGCESGVFIAPLQNEFTLIATAASSDRNSYGCAVGNAFTDFGQAVFGEQLPRERSFMSAFTNAALLIEKREVEANLLTSRPQISEGSAIRAKLRELEARLATGATE
jgi:hypothetical protein